MVSDSVAVAVGVLVTVAVARADRQLGRRRSRRAGRPPRVCNEGLRMLGRTGCYLEIGNINPGLTYELDPSTLIFGESVDPGMVYYEAEHLQQALDLIRRTRGHYPWHE